MAACIKCLSSHIICQPLPPSPPVIKLYLSAEVRDEDLDAVFGFVSSASDQRVQEELLEQLLSLLRSAPPPPGLLTSLWSRGLPLLVLIRAKSMAVRLISIKVCNML